MASGDVHFTGTFTPYSREIQFVWGGEGSGEGIVSVVESIDIGAEVDGESGAGDAARLAVPAGGLVLNFRRDLSSDASDYSTAYSSAQAYLPDLEVNKNYTITIAEA